MSFIIIYIFLVALIGWWAKSLGRDVFLCVLGAIFLSPLGIGIYLALSGPSMSSNRKCPKCAEIVKKEALICKHCHSELIPLQEDKTELQFEDIKVFKPLDNLIDRFSDLFDRVWDKLFPKK